MSRRQNTWGSLTCFMAWNKSDAWATYVYRTVFMAIPLRECKGCAYVQEEMTAFYDLYIGDN